ncbi:MAG: multidrug resistance protein [Heliobacteriaceae bacterium]|nr:multidrug resistance protein [Heliobacteriaceae bacterium]MDD4587432.1 multidrug resistance protein [Heliobacteriaceae bacterium]
MKSLFAQGLPLILVSVFFGAGGQVLLKLGANRLVFGQATLWQNLGQVGLQMAKNPLLIGGIFLFAVSSFIWIIAVAKIELSIAYPMVSLGYGLVLLASWGLLGESVSWLRVSGVLVICLGVIMVAQS